MFLSSDDGRLGDLLAASLAEAWEMRMSAPSQMAGSSETGLRKSSYIRMNLLV
jgi:hypothetical protein